MYCFIEREIPEGGDIIVPPFTWSSDISSIIWMGFNPIFIDIKLSSLGLDPKLTIRELKKNKKYKSYFFNPCTRFEWT